MDEKLQQIGGIVTGTTGGLRLHAIEPGVEKIKPVDERIDEPNHIVRSHIVIHRLRQ